MISHIAEHERQFREILEYCPAGLLIVDEDGGLLFHNARLREMLGYEAEESSGIDTRMFWHDLEQRTRIIETLRERGGQLLNEEAIWKTKARPPVCTSSSPMCRSPIAAAISASSAASGSSGSTTSAR